LKEKILAAHRGGIRRVLIPSENEKDVKDIPVKILKAIDIVLVDHMDEVLRQALVVDNPEAFLKAPASLPDEDAEKPSSEAEDEAPAHLN
jgi:ATP-dependent Lon protease